MAKLKDSKQKLSKSILEMKFMKKSKLKAEKEREDSEGRAMFYNVMTDRMKTEECQYVLEPSFIPCEQLILGRLSYHGMNVDIERIMEAENGEREEVENLSKEKDFTDQEMAQQYSNTVAIGRKFNTKRRNKKILELHTDPEPDRKKPKFLKPKD